jgi:hypothetical protein
VLWVWHWSSRRFQRHRWNTWRPYRRLHWVSSCTTPSEVQSGLLRQLQSQRGGEGRPYSFAKSD